MDYTIPNNLPSHVTANFTYLCHTCGATIEVIDATEQPHHCRIDLDAQRTRLHANANITKGARA